MEHAVNPHIGAALDLDAKHEVARLELCIIILSNTTGWRKGGDLILMLAPEATGLPLAPVNKQWTAK